MIRSRADFTPWKSGVSTSTSVRGAARAAPLLVPPAAGQGAVEPAGLGLAPRRADGDEPRHERAYITESRVQCERLANVPRCDGDEMIEEAERVGLGGQRHVPFQRRTANRARPLFAVAVQDALAGDGAEQDGERRERAPPVEPGLGGGNHLHDALQGSAPKPAAGPGIPNGGT